IPYKVTYDKISQQFTNVNGLIVQCSLTYPHLAFKHMPEEWIIKDMINRIYYITDGEIGYDKCSNEHFCVLKSQLATEIKKLATENKNVDLRILTVENKNYNFRNV